MTVIQTRITVAPDRSVSLATLLPVGEHVARISVQDGKSTAEQWKRIGLPVFDTDPWPEGTTFGREDIYGDDGR